MKIINAISSLHVICSICFGISLILFLNGFLLTRIAIETKNNCSQTCLNGKDCPMFSFLLSTSKIKDYCQLQAPVNKIVLLVIDGLRFDFINPANSSVNYKKDSSKYSLNAFNQKYNHFKSQVSIYKYIADPPTTTMQRIKGITTGSLPTFIDISKNFAGEEINEDSIIHQLLQNNNDIIQMGDDVWIDLFPNKFLRQYPYPAVNVKDLDSVDNGVIKNLFPEIKEKDWDVIIGHFLGVDHCGHTFGRDHPLMSQKLNQLNDVLKKIIKNLDAIDDDIMLVVLGDHGMNANGDHGGDSEDEVLSGLIMYGNSPKIQFHHRNHENFEIPQVDLVPTLSILMGLPIPFGNTGSIIENLHYKNLFPNVTQFGSLIDKLSLLAAYEINIDQIARYLDALTKSSGDFSIDEYNSLLQKLRLSQRLAANLVDTLTDESLKDINGEIDKTIEGYKQFLINVRNLCVKNWATFDISSMFFGVFGCLLSLIAFSIVHFSSQSMKPSFFESLVALVINVLVSGKLASFVIKLKLPMVYTYLIILLCFIYIISYLSKIPSWKFLKIRLVSLQISKFMVPVSLLAFYLSSFSNSFVINEDKISFFLAVSLSLALYFNQVFCASSQSSSKMLSIRNAKLCFQMMMLALLLTCLRCSQMFYKCREEQGSSCFTSSFLRSISALTSDVKSNFKSFRFVLSASSVLLLSLATKYTLRKLGNLNGYSLSVTMSSYYYIICPSSLIMTWIIQSLPRNALNRMPYHVDNIFPMVLSIMTFILLICLWMQPLLIYVIDNSKKELQNFSFNVDPVHQLFQHLKFNSKMQNDQTSKKEVVVYGLSSVYTSACVLFLTCAVAFSILLSSDGLAFAYLLCIASMVSVLILETSTKDTHSILEGSVSSATISMWMFLSYHFFFSTGHQHTITSIQWEAAFVVWRGNYFTNLIPASFIVWNTFSAQIVFTIAIPLLIVVPLVLQTMYPTLSKNFQTKKEGGKAGDYTLFQSNINLAQLTFNLLNIWVILHAAKLVSVMAAAAILCRHLMVWKIFAPRFMFESASFTIIIIFSVITYFFTARIDNSLGKWMKKLDNK